MERMYRSWIRDIDLLKSLLNEEWKLSRLRAIVFEHIEDTLNADFSCV